MRTTPVTRNIYGQRLQLHLGSNTKLNRHFEMHLPEAGSCRGKTQTDEANVIGIQTVSYGLLNIYQS